MAEISQTPNPNPPNPPPNQEQNQSDPSSDSDSKSAQRSTKPGTKRLFITLSVLVCFLSGLPILLKSTEIYRSPLPFAAISSLSASDSILFPCRFQAVFLRSDSTSLDSSLADRLSGLISANLEAGTGKDSFCGGCGKNYGVAVTVENRGGCVRSGEGGAAAWQCGAVGVHQLDGGDEEFDELVEAVIESGGVGGGGKVYTVVVVEREEDGEEVRIVVGKHRHVWIEGKVPEIDAVKMISEIFVKLFINGGNKAEEVTQGKGEFMPVGLDGSVVLSFSLLNADPNDWVYDWEFQKIDNVILAPVVEALAPIANISIESQVLYHTPKSAISYWDDNFGSYVFSTKDLPFFVNSNEWHLDTSIAAAGRSKVLQFVVYVPSATECPLLLRLSNGETSKTNGFMSPMWGGVVVWNPPSCSGHSPVSHATKDIISPQDMQKIFQVIIGQLRLLFGFSSDYLHVLKGGSSNILQSRRGFADWELDFLYRRHVCSNLLSCATTLESLSKLVQSLPRMIVTDEIGKQVKLSLEAAGLAQNNASCGVYDASAVSSRRARALAEDAFFHPSIMSISYSSIEHYFAIYMPFFAPVSLHVLLAAIKEVKRYKTERRKYLAFVAGKAKAL